MPLLHVLSYVALLAAGAFVTLSLASGLLYISDLIEENSRTSKIIGQRGIYIIVLLHGILFFTDTLPFLHVSFSVLCHLVYLQNFSSTWPLISLSSVTFISSCLLVIVDHFLWFFHFSRIAQETRYSHRLYDTRLPKRPSYTFADVTTFFAICVWLAPLFLFLSLSANDHALPTSAHYPSAGSRASLFKSFFDYMPDILPRLRPKAYRRNSEGIIAPRTPLNRSPVSLVTPSSPLNLSTTLPQTSFSPTISRGPGFQLNSPPKHARSRIQRRVTSGGTDETESGSQRSLSPSTRDD